MSKTTSTSPADLKSAPFSENSGSSWLWEEVLSSSPSSAGVYWFLDEKGKVLYVGKAKNLKKRLRQYTQITRLTNKIKKMVAQAATVKWEELESEFEAILIEAELIRLHQPPFNTLLKDDKSPIYLQLTAEKYPRVLTQRKRDIDQKQLSGTILGPFPSSYRLKEVLKIARKIFPWCNQAGDLEQNDKHQACFYYHLEQCPGACIGQISPEDYQENIHQLKLFLQGKKKTVLKNLEKKLTESVEELAYEQAAELRDKIQLIKDVTSQQFQLKPELVLPQLAQQKREQALNQLRKILLQYLKLPKSYPLKRIEAYDVSNTSGKLASVSMVTFIDGQPSKKDYRLFNIRSIKTPNDYQMLKEAIQRRQLHPEWGKPDLIIIDGGKGQLRSALKVWQWQTAVISIAKDPDRLILPLSVTKPENSTRLNIKYQVVRLPNDHPALQLVQHLRDESHRFSRQQHARRRLKNMFK